MAVTVTPPPYDPEDAHRPRHRGLRAPLCAGVARRGGSGERRRSALTGHGDRSHQLCGCRGAAPAREGALGPVSDRGNGIAGVSFLTLYRMAELLGAPRLADARRRPVSTPVLAAAIRARAAPRAGPFAAVADHPATEQALVESYRELLTLRRRGARRARRRPAARRHDVVRIYRAARTSLEASWYDEADLMDAAISEIERDARRCSPTWGRSSSTSRSTSRVPLPRCCAWQPIARRSP